MDESEPTQRITSRATSGFGRRWQAPSVAELQAMLPSYEVLEILGQGGMGAVYKARQKSLRRLVAIKVLPTLAEKEDELKQAERFKNEACTLAAMSHPGIVNVFDFGETGEGLLYFVMEYVDGNDVGQLILSSGKLAPDQAMSIIGHVCEALEYAHKNGVVHRDIKPANVLINRQGQVKVADFGLAKVLSETQVTQGLTRSNTAMGTPDYVAPEALAPGVTVDHRADLYAVGVMLYQMVTGEVPRGMFKLPSQKVAAADIRIDDIVCKAMEQDREERYQTAGDVRRAVEEIQTTPLAKTEPGSGGAFPAPSPKKRAKYAGMAGAAIVLGVVALLVWRSESNSKGSPSAESGRELAVKQQPATVATAAAKPPGRKVDLLALVDVTRDSVRGVWTRSERGVSVAPQPGVTVLELPYEPPEEYDFEVEFTPDDDGMNVNQYLRAGMSSFAWKLNSHKISPPLYGFELLDGRFAKDLREAATRSEVAIEKGHRYRSTIEVRRGSLRALLDDKQLVRWSGDFKRFSLEDHSRLRNERHLGVGSWQRAVTFHKIRVIEISGQGRIDAADGPIEVWKDWLGPRLAKGMFRNTGWITEADGITTDRPLYGQAVLPAGTRDGAVRLGYLLRDSEGGSVTVRHRDGGPKRKFYAAYDTGKTLFISYADGAEQIRLASGPIPAEIQRQVERVLEFRFEGPRLTATLNGAFTISATHHSLTEGECAAVLNRGALLKKVETLDLDAARLTREKEEFMQMISMLNAPRQVELVGEKLEKLNGVKPVLLPTFAMGKVTELTVRNAAPTITEIWPIAALRHLTMLSTENNKISDISCLAGLPLERLSVFGESLTDVSVLESLPLKSLSLRGSPVVDFSILAGKPLERLQLNLCRSLKDISFVKGMPLTYLKIDYTSVRDLSPLAGLPLTEVECNPDLHPDAALLRSLPALKFFNRKPVGEVLRAPAGEQASAKRP